MRLWYRKRRAYMRWMMAVTFPNTTACIRAGEGGERGHLQDQPGPAGHRAGHICPPHPQPRAGQGPRPLCGVESCGQVGSPGPGLGFLGAPRQKHLWEGRQGPVGGAEGRVAQGMSRGAGPGPGAGQASPPMSMVQMEKIFSVSVLADTLPKPTLVRLLSAK